MTSPDPAPNATTDPRVERTNEAVLGAAWELLIEGGPDAVRHRQVAAAANVSPTTVYKHFPSRGELLRAAIEVMGRPLPAEVTGHLRTDLDAMLADLVADLADEQRTRAIAAMIERAQHDRTVAAVRDGLIAEARERFRTIVETGIAAGELRGSIDVDVAFAGLLGTFFFTRLMAGEPVDADFATRVVDAFLADQRPR